MTLQNDTKVNRWKIRAIEQTKYEMYDSTDWFWLKDSIKIEDYDTFDFYYERIMRALDDSIENIKQLKEINFL